MGERGNRGGLAFAPARFGVTLARAGAAILALLAVACGSEEDANSREVFAIAHVTGTPNASLSVYEDRAYQFVDSGSESTKAGSLSASEFDSLAPHVSREALQALLAHGEADSEVCAKDTNGYIVNSKVGNACLVPQNVSDPQARGDLDAMVALFVRIAAAR